ncbi:hypothetical protein CYY_003542 [Polysphondylium violaceum]|uniref:Uncharacterized protein n=1 Tax=Polysphondylium violaceum TaxID=133409 RepID=A0A8J4V5U5_9MYCE|nr:hypothetical protein CYY_003542 [Polysphondylium violaceum]
MDSYLSFGLCEKALEFNLDVELPDKSHKQYLFPTRLTVDKIKTNIINDNAAILKKSISSEYILVVDNERIEIDFQRFIISHPRITEMLEQEPLVRIKIVSKNNFNPIISHPPSLISLPKETVTR